MREILFRGKQKDNGEWVEGLPSYNCFDLAGEITDIEVFNGVCSDFVEVIPESVGQFTGLTDKNGKRIFEDDILLIEAVCSDPNYTRFAEQVIFHKGKFCVTIAGWSDFERTPPNMCEVIGNIFDNPELLKGEDAK